MAGTDFSTRPYSYDDLEGDTTLAAFDLAAEDYQLKVSCYVAKSHAGNVCDPAALR